MEMELSFDEEISSDDYRTVVMSFLKLAGTCLDDLLETVKCNNHILEFEDIDDRIDSWKMFKADGSWARVPTIETMKRIEGTRLDDLIRECFNLGYGQEDSYNETLCDLESYGKKKCQKVIDTLKAREDYEYDLIAQDIVYQLEN